VPKALPYKAMPFLLRKFPFPNFLYKGHGLVLEHMDDHSPIIYPVTHYASHKNLMAMNVQPKLNVSSISPLMPVLAKS
jgi:hypothetical protein